MTDPALTPLFRVAAVAIGRNEGDRLKTCLASLQRISDAIVYVDSGSRDDSVAFARTIGVDVLELDMTVPFTAARARNAGWRRVRERHPDSDFVMFIDGDCELIDGFIAAGVTELRHDAELAAEAAHSSERTAAPIACWIAGRSGKQLTELVEVAVGTRQG